jgi:hypothetical protein
MVDKTAIVKYQNERVKWIISGLDYDLLTDWEEGFVKSVERQSNSGRTLSDDGDRNDGNSQMEVLERIYQRKGR